MILTVGAVLIALLILKKPVSKLTGVNNINVNLLANNMKVDFDEKKDFK